MGSQFDPAHVVDAIEQSGIRGITGRHAADNRPKDIPAGWSEEMMRHHFFDDAETALAALEDCVHRFNGRADGRIRCWVNIEGKEPCSLELHVGARALAERLGSARPIIWRPLSKRPAYARKTTAPGRYQEFGRRVGWEGTW
uniref:hypothetical protein n=1 Tax=Neorhizobium sp. EC2-8 TaxID=3129230 RepID=UPI003100D684